MNDDRDERIGATLNQSLPSRFMLHVDGAAACCVLRSEKLVFSALLRQTASLAAGRSSADRLDSEPGERIDVLGPCWGMTTIHRSEGDYFLQTDGRVMVNRQPTTEKLLASGDRVGLGPRSSIRITIPCPASASASIDLNGCRIPQTNARRLVVLENAIVISATNIGHVRTPEIARPHVVFCRDDQMWTRPLQAGDDELIGLTIDQPCEIGGVNIVLRSIDRNGAGQGR